MKDEACLLGQDSDTFLEVGSDHDVDGDLRDRFPRMRKSAATAVELRHEHRNKHIEPRGWGASFGT